MFPLLMAVNLPSSVNMEMLKDRNAKIYTRYLTCMLKNGVYC